MTAPWHQERTLAYITDKVGEIRVRGRMDGVGWGTRGQYREPKGTALCEVTANAISLHG